MNEKSGQACLYILSKQNTLFSTPEQWTFFILLHFEWSSANFIIEHNDKKFIGNWWAEFNAKFPSFIKSHVECEYLNNSQYENEVVIIYSHTSTREKLDPIYKYTFQLRFVDCIGFYHLHGEMKQYNECDDWVVTAMPPKGFDWSINE